MKKFIFYIIILLNLSHIYAQNILTGVIKDAKTKEPLTAVNIYIPQLKKGTVSDLNGKFTFKNIRLNQITVEFQYTGYQPVTKKVIFKTPEQHLEVLMHPTVFEMDEVIVSTGTNKLQKDNVMKVAHKNIAAMRRKGMQTIMEGIAQIPGVSNLSTGTGIAKPVIRGLSGNRVLVYNQGVRLENYQFGEEHGMGIDASSISGVEVIKGPASLLYGSDALGGVVYLIPEKYTAKNQSRYLLNSEFFSNMNGMHHSLAYKTSGEKWQFLARGSYKNNGDYTVPSGKRVLNSTNNAKDFKLGIGYHQKAYKSDFRYNFNRTLNGMADGLGHTSQIYDFTGTYQNLKNHNLSWKNNFKIGGSHFKTNIGFSQVKRALIKNNNNFIDMQLQTTDMDLKWYLPKMHQWESIIGMETMWQKNKNFGQHFLLPNARILNTGMFANVNKQFKQTIVQGGLRYDYRHIHTETINTQRPGFDKNLGSFSGALGIKQSLNDAMNLRFNLASGFRAPNLAELTSNGEHEAKIEIGDMNLKNEQNIQADLNWDYTSTHIEFFVNGFYNKIYNYIYLTPQYQAFNNLPVYAYQQENACLYGGEAGIHFHPHPWDWLHINSSFETVIGKKQTGDYLPLIPADQWKNDIRLTKKNPHKSFQKYFLSFEINRTFAARMPADETNVYPGYTLLHISLGADFKFHKLQGNLNLSVHNLTDEEYISNLSVLREDGIPNQGRNIILGLDLRL